MSIAMPHSKNMNTSRVRRYRAVCNEPRDANASMTLRQRAQIERRLKAHRARVESELLARLERG